jgi:hypothetical protein
MYTDLKVTVTVTLLTRTCAGCGCSCEFEFVPAKLAGTGVDTFRRAEQKRDAWWKTHNCGKAKRVA